MKADHSSKELPVERALLFCSRGFWAFVFRAGLLSLTEKLMAPEDDTDCGDSFASTACHFPQRVPKQKVTEELPSKVTDDSQQLTDGQLVQCVDK